MKTRKYRCEHCNKKAVQSYKYDSELKKTLKRFCSRRCSMLAREAQKRDIRGHNPCSKCGSDLPKHRRRRKGRDGVSISSHCIMCHEEDQKIREANPETYKKKLAYNRQYKKENRAKANAWGRKYYNKRYRKRPWYEEVGTVEWRGGKSRDGFSTLRYVPLYPGPGAYKGNGKEG